MDYKKLAEEMVQSCATGNEGLYPLAYKVCQALTEAHAAGLAEGEAKLAKAEANNTADPALKPGPACGGCGLDDCRFCD